MSKSFAILVACLGSMLVIAGCEDKKASSPVSATPAVPSVPSAPTVSPAGDNASAFPSTLFVPTAPADAKEVRAIRASGKDGQTVVVKGVVAGRAEPVAANRAILTLLDSSIQTCDKMPGDQCATPWDACCEPADELAEASLAVQVVDGEGKPLKATLKDVHGIQPMAKLTVTGTLHVSPDGKAYTVNATGITVSQ